MSVTFSVRLRGAPLRRTFVSHYDFFRGPQRMVFRTNEAGNVTISNAGSVTADPTGPNGTITVRVHAENSVVRVLDGNFPVPMEVTQEFEVANGGVVDINTDARQQDHFRIMDICRVVYDRVWRQFSPFNRQGRGAFPFGQKATLAETRRQLPRIELVYPDNSPAPLAWVEPVSVSTGFPLIHIKDKLVDRRLFGVPDPVPVAADLLPPLPTPADATLIPHELAHALYFASLPPGLRALLETRYLQWITDRVAAGLPPFHNTGLVTNQFIAWIECLGIFSERFFFFRARRRPVLTGAALRRAFRLDELSAAPLLTNLGGYQQVATLANDGTVVPALTGDDVEGAVYGALFLDFARRVGLREAVARYLNSGSDNVLEFDDLRNLIINRAQAAGVQPPQSEFDTQITEVATTWGM